MSRLVRLSGGGQYQMKVHVLALKLDTTEVVKQLPLSTESVPFRVIISPSFTDAQRAYALKQYAVRPEKLRQLLAWAKQHNPYFKDVQVDEALLASLHENSVPSSIVHVSDLADDQPLRSSAAKRSPPSATSSVSSQPSSHTSFAVHNRVLSAVEMKQALEEAAASEAKAGASAPSPSASAASSASAAADAAEDPTALTGDALDDGVVHYNAVLRVAAPVVDTGEFLREAAAAVPKYITSPVRPSNSSALSSSSCLPPLPPQTLHLT
jgi:hypothetical protein